MKLNEILKEERIKKHLSIRELSKLSGVNASYISRLERGIDENPGLEVLLKIAKVLEVEVDDLLYPSMYKWKKALVDNFVHIEPAISPQEAEAIKRAEKIKKMDKENTKVLDKINDIFKHYGYKIDRHTLGFEDMVKLSDDKNKVIFDVTFDKFYDYAKEMLKFIDRSVNSEIDMLIKHFK